MNIVLPITDGFRSGHNNHPKLFTRSIGNYIMNGYMN